MLTLYYVPQTRAGRARWMLEELGVPYQLHRLDPNKGETKTPEYLKVHPLGHVPALADGDLKMFESAAIVAYLADKYPDKHLAPSPQSPQRGAYYQWMMFCANEIEPWVARIAEHTRFFPEDKRNPALVEESKTRFSANLAAIEGALAHQQYLLGGEFSACDLMMSATLRFADFIGALGDRPVLKAYIERCTSRPALKRAMAD